VKIIDLRSDTVTLPNPQMLKSIADAELGDDGREGDPTARKLERLAAEKMGKEDALLVTSGTQANLVSLLAQTKPGDEIIVEAEAHINYYEAGGLSAIASLVPRPIRGNLGVLNPSEVDKTMKTGTPRSSRVKLICIENTHNRAGGTCVSPPQIRELREVADKYEIPIYMDGARIFNSAVAQGLDAKELVKDVDSLMFCLSKGLSCPIGSLVVGDQAFIRSVREWRKILGGTLRQSGVIAAPGIIALETMIDRLKEDHDNAKKLAEGLEEIKGIILDMKTVQTNIVKLDIGGLGCDIGRFVSELKKQGVEASVLGGTTVRMVTHRGIESKDIDVALSIIETTADRLRT
jgi:threonine aldolase